MYIAKYSALAKIGRNADNDYEVNAIISRIIRRYVVCMHSVDVSYENYWKSRSFVSES